MSLADEVRTVRQRVFARLTELEPLVREYEELRLLAAELGMDVPGEGDAHSQGASDAGNSDDAGTGEPPAEAAAPPSPVAEAGEGSAIAAPGDATQAEAGVQTGGGTTRRRRPGGAAGEAGREARLLGALRANPGATTAELGTMLGLPATSLYRPVRELTSAGTIVKRGRGLYVGS